jgi:hypothetical protein
MNPVQYVAGTDEAEIRRIADELFITTDLKDWDAARALFVDGSIEADMSYSKLTRGNDAVRTHSA